jgi:phage host-nuclease inhibitor protein Gam
MPNLMRMLTDGISEGIPALQNAATSAAQAIADPLGKLDMSNASSVDKYARLILDKGDALSAIDNEYKPQIDALNRQMADAGTREERMALQRQLQQLEDAYAQKRDATTKSYDDQITAFKNGTTTLTNINAQATATNTAITNAGAAGAVNAFTQMAQNIAGQAQMLAQNVKLAWNDMWTTLTAATTQALTAIVSAMTAGSAQLVNTLTAMIATLKAMFTQLATDARTWGANLGEMFADGLRSKLAEVEAIAKQIAATVNSYVGFHSPAERGPGADADTWAPNFMRMFTDGIVNARPALQAALSGVAMDMNFAVGGGYAGVAPVAGGGRAPIIVNITYNGGSRSELDKFARDVQAIIRNAQ